MLSKSFPDLFTSSWENADSRLLRVIDVRTSFSRGKFRSLTFSEPSRVEYGF